MTKDDEILKSMVLGGIIGAALGALLFGKREGSALGVLAGSVILATLKANENAQKSNVPFLIEEDNVIYEINSSGEKKFVKVIPKQTDYLPERFKLK
jgi:hypothetical protein